MEPATGRLVLLGTPIGHLDDASPRLRDTLASADLIAAEDTRTTRALADRLGVALRARMISAHDHNEASRAEEVIAAVREGQTVVLASDAGMPAVSDPGYRLARAVADAGETVQAVPGPSAVTTALALSGLPSDRFCFEGFLPRKPGERRGVLAELAGERRTMVFFESPHRIRAALDDLVAAFGPDRPAALCRELTKRFEETRRGTLAELAADEAPIRGEITLVIAGAAKPAAARPEDHVEAVLELVASGHGLKEASAEIAAQHGLRRRDLYQAALAARPSDGDH